MTQETKHTPAPWKVNRHQYASWSSIIAPNGFSICDLTDCDNDDANAHLIAAAPELLEALELTKALDEALSGGGIDKLLDLGVDLVSDPSTAIEQVYKIRDKAIAKARGE